MPGLIKVLLLSAIVTVSVNANESSTVKIAQGILQGTKKTSAKGQEYHSFMGIRYAKPPIGKLRFKLPEPADKWDVTFDASEEVKCLQLQAGQYDGAGKIAGQEDCLVVNVFTNNLQDKGKGSLKPVMVWIHGGGFVHGEGTGELYGPDLFMDEDVVIVTINYRLGTLGFLSTGDDIIPGNMGMWDQVLALKWVQRNIQAFGGDPDSVTIFGESAGGMSVSYLVLSPAGSGLFHKAIVMSGPPIGSFVKTEKHPAYYARTMAAKLGCDPEASTKDIYTCLNKMDGATLVNPQFRDNEFDYLWNLFKPVVDDFSSRPFLPKEPLTLMEEEEFNRVPLMVGSTKHDGLMFTSFNRNLKKDLKEKFDEFIPLAFLNRETDSHDKSTAKFAQMVKEEMFQGRVPDLDTDDKYTIIDLYGDATLIYPSTKFARIMAGKSDTPVFEYRYHYAGSFTMKNFLWPLDEGLGTVAKFVVRNLGRYVGLDLFANEEWACHLDELFLMFKSSFIPFDTVYTDRDKKVSALMLQMWTNFARHGDPTPKGNNSPGDRWLPVGPDKHPKHLEISDETPTLKTDSAEYKRRIDFWERVYQEHPPLLHFKKSPTFKNTKMYKTVGDEKAKEEL